MDKELIGKRCCREIPNIDGREPILATNKILCYSEQSFKFILFTTDCNDSREKGKYHKNDNVPTLSASRVPTDRTVEQVFKD